VKTLGDPRPWPPELCDEVRQYIETYNWSSTHELALDDLQAILEELDGWLADQRLYTANQTRIKEWDSLLEDLDAACALIGDNLRALLPTLATLRKQLHDKLGLEPATRAQLRPVLEQLLTEARHPDAAAAAFDDLVEAVRDQSTPTALITGRVDLLDGIMRFSGHALAPNSRTLSGILNNDTFEIAGALHYLDNRPMVTWREAREDPDAGLTETERLDLLRRVLKNPPPPGHHIVWVFYGNARVRNRWRLPIGACEFFDGPALIGALEEVDRTLAAGEEYPGDRHPFNTVPEELQGDDSMSPHGRRATDWPDDEEHWVAVRVDLGTDNYPNALQAARDQADALLVLAALDNPNGTSWIPLIGFKGYLDGRPNGGSVPFSRENEVKWLNADHTDDWLDANQTTLGAHLIAGDPHGHAVVQAARTLTSTLQASTEVRLLEAVRVIESEASALRVNHWKEVLTQYLNPAQALFDTRVAAFYALQALGSDDELYEALPHLRTVGTDFITDGGTRIDLAGAVKKLPAILSDLPENNRSARRVREVAADLATPASVAAAVLRSQEQAARMTHRLHRMRNSLTHAGPRQSHLLQTSADFATPKARHAVGVSVRALLDGKPVPAALTQFKDAYAEHIRKIPAAVDAYAALFPPAEE